MLNKAAALTRANRLPEAAAIYEKLLAQKPRNPVVLRAVIQFHNRYTRRFRAAVPLAETLVTLKPKDATSHILAAETYCNCARPFLAQAHVETALSLAPDDPDALFIAAVTAMQRNKFQDALAYLDRALILQPDHAPSLIQKGRALRDLGALADARDIATTLLQQNSADENALELYVQTTKITADDPIWQQIKNTDTTGWTGERMVFHQQLLGKGFHDLHDDDAAFDAAKIAKKNRPSRHSSANYTQFVSALCQRVGADIYAAPSPDTNRQPLLIVGMPRSGSTLLEKFLCGHSEIATAGESPSLNVILQDIGVGKHNGPALAQAITQIPDEAVRRNAQRYLEEIAQDGTPTYIIDKSLHNFELLGFFARLFPHAPIIHMTRDPLDTCVSCYLQPLSAWHGYTQDLTDLGRYFIQYKRLMSHWASVLPNPMLTISYEHLIGAPEKTMRGITDFLNLPWEDAAADHLSHKAAARTLSYGQVTQPLYQTSKSRWLRYDAQIGPLKDALAPLYPDGFSAPAASST